MWLARQYLQALWTPSLRGKRTRVYSINLLRAPHASWFKHDLERLFDLLATGAIRPRLAERISFDQVAEAHRRLEAGGLDGKLVPCPVLSCLCARRSRGAQATPPDARLIRAPWSALCCSTKE